MNPIGPRGVYDEAKRFAEAMTMAYHRYHGVDTRIVRIFNTYGPRMRPRRRARRLELHRAGAEQASRSRSTATGRRRDRFCYVDDEVEGIYRLFMHGDTEPTNIGNPNEFTVRQLAELVLELTGTESPIDTARLPDDDPKVRKPDITRARDMLGWEPKVSFVTA